MAREKIESCLLSVPDLAGRTSLLQINQLLQEWEPVRDKHYEKIRPRTWEEVRARKDYDELDQDQISEIMTGLPDARWYVSSSGFPDRIYMVHNVAGDEVGEVILIDGKWWFGVYQGWIKRWIKDNFRPVIFRYYRQGAGGRERPNVPDLPNMDPEMVRLFFS